MKRTFKLIGIIAFTVIIGFLFMACGEGGGDPGKITITNYNGVSGRFLGGVSNDTNYVFAASAPSANFSTFNGVSTSNNPITLNVYKKEGGVYKPFSGNVTFPSNDLWFGETTTQNIFSGFPTNEWNSSAVITITDGNVTINFGTQMTKH